MVIPITTEAHAHQHKGQPHMENASTNDDSARPTAEERVGHPRKTSSATKKNS